MRKLLAIDPGTTESAYVVLAADGETLLLKGKVPNEDLLACLPSIQADCLAMEMVASYGMPVGREVFETCVWIGRFVEAWGGDWDFVYRKDVKLHLCGSVRAKDGNVRQAILDKYPRTGGGKVPQIGVKSKPGPLYGVSSDVWAALGVALTYAETTGAQDSSRRVDGPAVLVEVFEEDES